ncbi:hypothetical protein EW146_g259 [Bondarzewia mesenterica]|uniref:Glucose-methanol-choline oxidoreductase N-terminal domain-containing protein n=1 Tax=Bondarzewia mesenterica TaxID=1095465 RepID=A0A4S4MDV0_9AGAM|nr:hypothetical protein EW146_g259 [Bondarzewia mesenterica]
MFHIFSSSLFELHWALYTGIRSSSSPISSDSDLLDPRALTRNVSCINVSPMQSDVAISTRAPMKSRSLFLKVLRCTEETDQLTSVPMSLSQMCFLRRVAFSILFSTATSVALQDCSQSSTSGSGTNAQTFAAIKYDYLIIGGGTAGLALASRLAENEKFQVGVIEAGTFHQNDPLIDIPAYVGQASGNPLYDWNFVTVPQPGANGRSIAMPRGKLLGGSSGLNSMAWTRASKPEYDAWQSFAEGGTWDWDNIVPYMQKSTSVFPNQANSTFGVSAAAYDPLDEGFDGPVSASFNNWYSDPFPVYIEALNAIGIETNANADNGTNSGIANARSDVNRSLGSRSYAAPTYYCRSANQKNFQVLMQAQATKVLLKSVREGNGDEFEAVGVQFVSNSRTFVAQATKEIILSAGVFQSPQLLELSGIGNKTLLEGLGINTLIDLPEVGENLQDHLFAAVQYELKPGLVTFDELRINATFAAEQAALYNTTHSGVLAATDSALAFLPLDLFLDKEDVQSILNTFDEVVAESKPSPFQKMQYDVQREWIEQGTVPQVELIMWSHGVVAPAANKSYITVFAGGLHINTSVALAHPVINPAWLSNDFDLKIVLEALKVAQGLGSVEAITSIAEVVTSPPPDVQGDTALSTYIRETVGSAQHPMGTAAMGPKALGGKCVVDGNLKVYGTTNLRVCDASIFPISIGTHLQSTVYAIAEKASHFNDPYLWERMLTFSTLAGRRYQGGAYLSIVR